MAHSEETLTLSGQALRYFFDGTELYRIDHAAEKREPGEQGISLKLYGNPDSDFLMVFNYPGELKTASFWPMVKGLMENPKALSRKEEEFCLINLAENKGATAEQLVADLNPRICMVWGGAATDNGEPYPSRVIGTTRLLYTDEPEILSQSKDLKNKLWMALKPLL